jgi:signal transduction histidine kinase
MHGAGAARTIGAVLVMRVLRRPVALDLALALILCATSVERSMVLLTVPTDGAHSAKLESIYGSLGAFQLHRALWWVAALVAVVAVLLRRRRPLAAFLLASASAAWLMLDTNLEDLPLALAAVLTLYTLASLTAQRRIGVAALAGALVAAWLLTVHRQYWVQPGLDGLLDAAWRESALSASALPALLLGIAWAAGDNARTRRLHLAGLEKSAEQRAELAVAAERARLTRELHDVVAHGISVMVVQAQGASAALRHHPERTATALDHIVETGRASLADMRRLLGLARRDPRHGPELAPQPGIAALPALVDQVRDAGTTVSLQVEGQPTPLSSDIDLSAYRIVQEGLTNTLKHAGEGASATVRLAFEPAGLEIEIADDGRGTRTAPPGRDGHGLIGIRERVAALGGTIDAGPRDGGGFSIRALLPTATVR